MHLFQILEEEMGANKRENWKETLLNVNLRFLLDDF